VAEGPGGKRGDRYRNHDVPGHFPRVQVHEAANPTELVTPKRPADNLEPVGFVGTARPQIWHDVRESHHGPERNASGNERHSNLEFKA
jgi:hypothetical protein